MCYYQYNKGDIFSRHKRNSHTIHCPHIMQLQRPNFLLSCAESTLQLLIQFTETCMNLANLLLQSCTFVPKSYPQLYKLTQKLYMFSDLQEFCHTWSRFLSLSVERNQSGSMRLHDEKLVQGSACCSVRPEGQPHVFPHPHIHTQITPCKTQYSGISPPPSSQRTGWTKQLFI